MGVENNELKCHKIYLKSRTKRTKIENVGSYSKINYLEAPQGSVSVTKLFKLHANSVERVFEHSQINMFADYTMAYILYDGTEEAETKMNKNLLNYEKWLPQMNLGLNTEKTKCTIKDENIQ